jgi:hypothetical protein
MAQKVLLFLIPLNQFAGDGVVILFAQVLILTHQRWVFSGADYDILAESVNDRLFFAGEATNCAYPATMHGVADPGFG